MFKRDRNHLRLLAELSHDAGVTVLHEGAHRLGGVHDLESVQRRRQSGQHFRLGHRQIHHAELQQRMAAGQQVLRVHVGDGAGGGDVHVAAHQNRADGRARLQRFGLLAAR